LVNNDYTNSKCINFVGWLELELSKKLFHQKINRGSEFWIKMHSLF
jgi:hypothetical protein